MAGCERFGLEKASSRKCVGEHLINIDEQASKHASSKQQDCTWTP